MAVISIVTLKTYFQTGDFPTENQFIDLIDTLAALPVATGLTVGTTAIASGTAGRLLYEGAGNVLQESANMTYDATNGVKLTSTGNSSATWAQRNYNLAGTEIFSIYSSGQIRAGTDTNLFIGINAGIVNSGDNANTFVGNTAGQANTTGVGNTAFGNAALKTNITTGYNTAIGDHALELNIGNYNTALGFGVLRAANNASAIGNVGVGYNALKAVTTGAENTMAGDGAGQLITTSSNNTGFGSNALAAQTTGSGYNDAFGVFSLATLTTGSENAGFAEYSLNKLTTGVQNTALGGYAGYPFTTGSRNTCVGYFSGFNSAVGSSDNIFLGHMAGRRETGSNRFFIDNQDRSTEAASRAASILNGVMSGTVANQTLTINAKIYMKDTITPFNYWSAVIVSGVLTWTDTGTTVAP